MSYMKWVSLIHNAVIEQHEKGLLGVLAALTQIPEYRLRDWATKRTIDDLSYTELTAIHDVILEVENENSKQTNKRDLQQTNSSQQIDTGETANCCCDSSGANLRNAQQNLSFDSSD